MNIAPQTLTVGLGERSYDITIEAGSLARAGALFAPLMESKRAIIITDSNVAPLYAGTLEASLAQAGIASDTLTVPAGEASKAFASYEKLMEAILALQPDRKTTLIALGGGVIGDLCGFAAATLLRGVPFIQIPTSLLAMVDSSVGGKTGINSAKGKNLIGAFYQPRAVLIDPAMLDSLRLRERKAGYAEIVKYGALGDADFFHWLETNGNTLLAGETDILTHAIHHCCSMKADIVAEDEREAGVRALLNFGHTFAHALEAEAGYDGRLLHGEAVSIGMVMAAQLSAELGLCSPDVAQRLTAHLAACDMPTSPHDIEGVEWNPESIASHFTADKKAEEGKAVFILLEDIGTAMVVRDIAAQAALTAVETVLNQ